MDYKNYIASIPDFPKKGIMFRDVTPIMENPAVFKEVTKEISEFIKGTGATKVIGPEARGFWLGIPAAMELDLPFVPVRKPGKLPRKVVSESYALEYGTDTLCIHEDSIKAGDKVVIVDDLLATGGTVKAIINLCTRLGVEVVGAAFVVELDELKGKDKFGDINVFSLTHYEGE